MKSLIRCAILVVMFAACGGHPTHPSCTETGTACTTDKECCTGSCDPTVGLCTHVAGQCLAADANCSVGPDCCSFACVNFKCSGNQCKSDGAGCSSDGECCGGLCGNGTCTPLNPSCKTSGNACAGNSDCCSQFCNAGICDGAPSYCTVQGDACSTDAECCSGLCQISTGATLGTCEVAPASGAGGCTVAGEVCGGGASYVPGQALPTCGGSCCSRACFPYGPSGVLICQPPSGCRPTGELCSQDSDCCGGPGQPDNGLTHVTCSKVAGFPVGHCDNGNKCSPAGAICRLQTISCNATDDCCAGNVQQFNTCHQDSLGIPRCGGAGLDCSDPQSKVGMTCASSADCCGLPCVNGICGASCVMQNGTCTTSADCCSGLPCNIPGGSATGTCGNPIGCAAYGQACTQTSDCCNGVPCTGGICQAIQ
jgi:hypothetical protein